MNTGEVVAAIAGPCVLAFAAGCSCYGRESVNISGPR